LRASEDDLHGVVAVEGFGDGAEAFGAPGLALGGAGLGDEDGDGAGLVDSLLGQERLGGVGVVGRGEDLRLDEVGVGLERGDERGAVAEGFDDAEVVGDLAEAVVEGERGGGELWDDRVAGAEVAAAERRGEDDAAALVAGGLEDGEGFADEGAGGAEGLDRAGEAGERAGRGDEGFKARVVAEDFEGEAAGGGGDAGSGDGRVDRGDERGRVDRRAKGEGVLQEEEVADRGERRWGGGEGAFELGQRGEGGEFG